jgi:hypothetical protein
MQEYVGIHTDKAGSTWLEKVRARNADDAFDLMERNDTELQVFPQHIFEKLNRIELPVGQMIKVS